MPATTTTIISQADLDLASPAELIDVPPAPVPAAFRFPEGLEQDERDCLFPITPERTWHTSRGTPYTRMKETRWILAVLPRDVSLPKQDPILPEEAILREIIHESNGILSIVLEKMGWHAASKAELLRWLGKLNLENDIAIARDGMIDKAEAIVNNTLDLAEDVETAKFVLKTAGKKRGWSDKEGEGQPQGRNVYQFINVVSGSGTSTPSSLDEAGLVRYLEDKLTAQRKTQ